MISSSLNSDLLTILIQRCRASAETLSTAESCTGGLIATTLTDLPGSSTVFKGGVVAYANEAKTNLLGVNGEDLSKHGAVSAIVATQMAIGAQKRFQSTIAVSTTGIAGPDGERPGKPVGTVYYAIAKGSTVRAFHLLLSGSRAEIRRTTVRHVFEAILCTLDGSQNFDQPSDH